jgi:hypothetical protein
MKTTTEAGAGAYKFKIRERILAANELFIFMSKEIHVERAKSIRSTSFRLTSKWHARKERASIGNNNNNNNNNNNGDISFFHV